MTDAGAAAKPIKPAGAFSAWEFGLAMRYLRARRREGGIVHFFGRRVQRRSLIND